MKLGIRGGVAVTLGLFLLALSFVVHTAWKITLPPTAESALPQSFHTAPASSQGVLGGGIVTSTTQLHLSSGRKKSELNLRAHREITTSTQTVVDINDAVTLVRQSAFPVDKANSTMNVRGLVGEHSRANFYRSGLQYLFPVRTEQRSYPYFDPFIARTIPIDYAGKITYIPPAVLPKPDRTTLRAFTFSQDSGPFLLPQASASADTYYAVHREVIVEPISGTILNLIEKPLWFHAPGQGVAEDYAREFFSAPLESHGTDRHSTASHTAENPSIVFTTHLEWDETTQAATSAYAIAKVKSYTSMRITQYLTRSLAFLCFIYALLCLVFTSRTPR